MTAVSYNAHPSINNIAALETVEIGPDGSIHPLSTYVHNNNNGTSAANAAGIPSTSSTLLSPPLTTTSSPTISTPSPAF
ncbi:hypothetical protein HDU76_003993, partial [Blyttiomyces sp. JEL0837]